MTLYASSVEVFRKDNKFKRFVAALLIMLVSLAVIVPTATASTSNALEFVDNLMCGNDLGGWTAYQPNTDSLTSGADSVMAKGGKYSIDNIYGSVIAWTTWNGRKPSDTFVGGKAGPGVDEAAKKQHDGISCVVRWAVTAVANMILWTSGLIVKFITMFVTWAVNPQIICQDGNTEGCINLLAVIGGDGTGAEGHGGIIGALYEGLYLGLASLVFVAVGLYMLWKGIVKGQIRNAWFALLWGIFIFAVGVFAMTKPIMLATAPLKVSTMLGSCMIESINGRSCLSDVDTSKSTPGTADQSQICLIDPKQELTPSQHLAIDARMATCKIWKAFVLEPWSQGQFASSYEAMGGANEPPVSLTADSIGKLCNSTPVQRNLALYQLDVMSGVHACNDTSTEQYHSNAKIQSHAGVYNDWVYIINEIVNKNNKGDNPDVSATAGGTAGGGATADGSNPGDKDNGAAFTTDNGGHATPTSYSYDESNFDNLATTVAVSEESDKNPDPSKPTTDTDEGQTASSETKKPGDDGYNAPDGGSADATKSAPLSAKEAKVRGAHMFQSWAGNAPMTRISMALVAVISAILCSSILVFDMGRGHPGAAILAMVYLFLGTVLTLFAPIFLLAGIHPTTGRKMFLGWLELELSCIMKYFFLMLWICVVVEIYGAILGSTDNAGLILIFVVAMTTTLKMYQPELLKAFGTVDLGGYKLANTMGQRFSNAMNNMKNKVGNFGSAVGGGALAGFVSGSGGLGNRLRSAKDAATQQGLDTLSRSNGFVGGAARAADRIYSERRSKAQDAANRMSNSANMAEAKAAEKEANEKDNFENKAQNGLMLANGRYAVDYNNASVNDIENEADRQKANVKGAFGDEMLNFENERNKDDEKRRNGQFEHLKDKYADNFNTDEDGVTTVDTKGMSATEAVRAEEYARRQNEKELSSLISSKGGVDMVDENGNVRTTFADKNDEAKYNALMEARKQAAAKKVQSNYTKQDNDESVKNRNAKFAELKNRMVAAGAVNVNSFNYSSMLKTADAMRDKLSTIDDQKNASFEAMIANKNYQYAAQEHNMAIEKNAQIQDFARNIASRTQGKIWTAAEVERMSNLADTVQVNSDSGSLRNVSTRSITNTQRRMEKTKEAFTTAKNVASFAVNDMKDTVMNTFGANDHFAQSDADFLKASDFGPDVYGSNSNYNQNNNWRNNTNSGGSGENFNGNGNPWGGSGNTGSSSGNPFDRGSQNSSNPFGGSNGNGNGGGNRGFGNK